MLLLLFLMLLLLLLLLLMLLLLLLISLLLLLLRLLLLLLSVVESEETEALAFVTIQMAKMADLVFSTFNFYENHTYPYRIGGLLFFSFFNHIIVPSFTILI